MKNIRKIAAFLIACLMALTFAACANGGNGGDDSSTTARVPDNQGGSGDRLSANDGIPKQSFKGYKYRINCMDNQKWELTADDSSNYVDAAVRNRNFTIEEKYDIEIIPMVTTGYSSGAGQLIHEQYITTSLSAGDQEFDTVLMCAWRAGTIIVQGLFKDLNTVGPLNFEQPWWNSYCNSTFGLDGQLYAAVGDMSLTTLALAHAYLYNKKLAEDNHLEDLYQVVERGDWTIEYVKQITTNLYVDQNHDDTRDTEDLYGFAAGVVTNLDAYPASFGVDLTAKNAYGELSLATNTEKLQLAYEKVSDLFFNSNGSYVSLLDSEYSDRYKMFSAGNVMFIDGTVNVLANYGKDMEDPYGVLPYPKLSADQKEYYSNAHDNFSVLCMAYNVEDTDFVGKVTESLTCESYRTVVTAYYDITLKDRYTDDKNDELMLDLIMKGRNYDISVLFAPTLNRLYYLFRDCVRNHKTVASALGESSFSWEASLLKLHQTYAKLAAGQ
ncbi:MAG: hypothetical protein J5830_02145 [Clostridia bacterium]|nr:hypothetical protein [Clostridia bacterium]